MANRIITLTLKANASGLLAGMKQAQQSTKQTADSFKRVSEASKAFATGLGSSVSPKVAAQMKAVSDRMLAVGQAARTAAAQQGLMYTASGRLVDQFGREVSASKARKAGLAQSSQAVAISYKIEEDAARSAADAAAELAAKTQARKQALSDLSSGLMVAGAAMAAPVGVAVKKFADFDKAMSSVSAATHASQEDLKSLRDAAVKAGADTAFSAVEAAQAIEELAKAGVSTQDIMGGGLDGALSLAAAGSLDVGKAAEIASSALTQFQLKGSDVSHVADLLAAGAGKAQGGVEDLGMAMNQSGLVAAQTGLSIEETVGGLTAFANAGLIGSDAGTSFKTMLQSLTPSSKEAAQLMDELGITAYDAQGNFVGLSQFAGNLQNGLKDLSVEQQNAAMKTIFGSDAVRAASVLYKEGAQGVQKWIDAVDDSGYAAETAARMQDNLAGDLEKLGGSLDTVFLKSGSGANDFLRGLVQGAEDLVDAIGNIPEGVLSTGAMIAGLGGGAMVAVGGFTKLVTGAHDALDAFRTMQTATPRLAKALKGLGIAGAVAGGTAVIAQGLVEIHNAANKLQADATNTGQVVTGLKTNSAALSTEIDRLDISMTNAGGSSEGMAQNLGDVLRQLETDSPGKAMESWLATTMNYNNGTKRGLDLMSQLSESMAAAAKAGDFEGASHTMQELVKSAESGGKGFDDLKPRMTSYFQALQDKASAAGVQLSDDELWGWALSGEVPDAVRDAASALSEADREASGLNGTLGEMPNKAPTLQELADAATEAANSFLAARDASRGFEEAIDAAEAAAKKNGETLDDGTAKGRENAAALDAIAASALEVMQGAGSANDKMKALSEGREAVLKAADAFGMGAEEAAAYADKAGMVPESVYTEFDSNADDLQAKLKTIIGLVTSDPTGSVTITENSPEVIANLEAMGLKVKRGAKGQITVTDAGTASKTGQAIDAVARKKRQAEIIAVARDNASWDLSNIARDRTSTITVTTINKYKDAGYTGSKRIAGVTGTGGMTYATGGRLPGHAAGYRLPTSGPGTEKTDGFLGVNHKGMPLARVDAGEWIINGKSSQKYNGLLSAINRDDPSVQGLAALASGGRVSWSKADQGKSKAALAKAKAEARAAERAEKAAQKAYDKIDGKKANKGAKSSAKSKLSAAKKRSDKADKALERAEKAYQDDRERTSRLRELEFDTRRDLYRGDIRDSYGAGNYSGVDRLFEQSNNKDLSSKQRANMRKLAYEQERQTKALTAKQAGLEKRLESAQSKYDELAGVRDGVKSQVSGAFDMKGLVGQKDSWGYSQKVTKGSLMSFGKKLAAGARTLSSKVKELQKRGFPASMLQQVIDEWSDSQTFELADAMLAMNKSERSTFTGYFKSVEAYGANTGKWVTQSMYKGGIDASQGLVRGIESDLASVDKAFTKMGTTGEKAFRKSLGINSPSRVLKAAGVWAGKGAALGVRDSIPENERAMRDLAEAQAAAYQPQYRVPASAEVRAFAASQGQPAEFDYDRLAEAMTRAQRQMQPATVAIGDREVARLGQEIARVTPRLK